MVLTIRSRTFRDECVDEGKLLYRRGVLGGIFDASDRKRTTLAAEGWNWARHQFPTTESYFIKPQEPPLTWYSWFPFLSKERIESEGLTGLVVREQAADQTMFRVGDVEWRYDSQQDELYFDPPPPSLELRHTLLAFVFFRRCRRE